MRRRTLLATLLAAMTRTEVVGAIEPSYRVAVISGLPHDLMLDAFLDELARLGYEDGGNARIDVRSADMQLDRLPELAREIVSSRPHVIFARSTPGTRAVVNTGTNIPVVFVQVSDPIGSGFVRSLARPGGNVTGLSLMAFDVTAKRLELIREILPKVTRVAVLNSPRSATHLGEEAVRQAEAGGLTVTRIDTTSPADLPSAFASLSAEGCEAMIVTPDILTTNARRQIIALATKYRLPTIHSFPFETQDGALIAYGPDLVGQYRRAAAYVARILEGTSPADLPVEQPTRPFLSVNLRTASALGIEIPAAVLARADEVIE
jgi:putative ABC transport system substrate-binding protein